jgi:hypothetical protein
LGILVLWFVAVLVEGRKAGRQAVAHIVMLPLGEEVVEYR